jgi:CubicO group peptidase (beta-lactamase class C family)
MKRLIAVIALLPLTCSTTAASRAVAAPGGRVNAGYPGKSTGLIHALQQANATLARMAGHKQFSGSVLVARRGSLLLSKGYGMADRKRRIPDTAQTQYRIGTTTNQFTALAVLQLQAAGKLHVQDHVCSYVPQCPKAWRPITIHQLLTHTSGMDNFPAQFDPGKPMTPARLVAAAKATPLLARPGSTWSYSNLGYDVLGFIIEKVSHRSYGGYLQAHIFAPLKMSDSAYFFQARPRRLAVGYADAYSQSDSVDMSNAFSAAGVYSTVDDLYRWDRALSDAAVVPPALVGTMFGSYVTICRNNCPVPGDPPESGYTTSVSRDGYGYGWGIARLQPSHHRLFGSAGGFSGGLAYNGVYPDDRVEIIVLTNQDDADIAGIVALLQRAVLDSPRLSVSTTNVIR